VDIRFSAKSRRCRRWPPRWPSPFSALPVGTHNIPLLADGHRAREFLRRPDLLLLFPRPQMAIRLTRRFPPRWRGPRRIHDRLLVPAALIKGHKRASCGCYRLSPVADGIPCPTKRRPRPDLQQKREATLSGTMANPVLELTFERWRGIRPSAGAELHLSEWALLGRYDVKKLVEQPFVRASPTARW